MNDEKRPSDRSGNGRRRAHRGVLACLSLSYSGKAGDCFIFPPPPLIFIPHFSFSGLFFWRGGGYLIHMLGLPARFLSLGLGGLVGCGVGEGWFCMLKALLSKVCRSKK